MLAGIAHARTLGKRADGHTAGAYYEKLNAVAAAGIGACHEAITRQEVMDRLRLGLSSLRPDLPELVHAITDIGADTRRLMLTVDGPAPSEGAGGIAPGGLANLVLLPDFASFRPVRRDAETYNTTTHLLAIGRDPAAMRRAAKAVVTCHGGIATGDGWRFPMSIAGMISPEPFAETVRAERELEQRVRPAGFAFGDILYALLFLTCDFSLGGV